MHGAPTTANGSTSRQGGATLQGELEVVTFHSAESLYTVLRVNPEKGYGDPEDFIPGRVTAVGEMESPAEGMRVRLEGRWTSHPKHGRQFRFETAAVLAPADEKGLVRYLASPTFRGIGEKTAAKIVETLGVEALEKIRSDPTVLGQVPGLKGAIAEELSDTLRAQFASHQLRAFLTGLELNRWQVDAVAKKYGADCEELLRKNPYLLCRGIEGIAFRTADRAARALGLAPDAPARFEAAVLFLLRRAANDGHTLVTETLLTEKLGDLVGPALAPAHLQAALAALELAGDVVLDDETLRNEHGPVPAIYLPMYHTCERRVAQNLAALVARDAEPLATEAELTALEGELDMVLHPDQRAAVLGLLGAPVGLLTGGPGVGKTTVLELVVTLAERAGKKVLLASPTGRAAKRMTETTGREATTVHRLLGFDPVEHKFEHDEDQPLAAGIIVVDEVSMLDLLLAHALVKAVAPPTRLLFVGDPNQLPSVGAGNVLGDLLTSGTIATFRLTQIFRQSESSRIVTNAHRILTGELPEFPPPVAGGERSDFYLFKAESDESTARLLVDVVTERIPRTFGLDWKTDIQVLSPMYKGASGVDALNDELAARLDTTGFELEARGRVWPEGLKVIHTKNDYEREVFNGDMGFVHQVYGDGSGLVVRYPEQDLFYAVEQLGELRPAFAITVHRSQGSEYPCVVIPLVARHFVMLQRNLFYTAITRAKQLVVLVGQERALELAVTNASQAERLSALAPRLAELLAAR